MDASKIPDFLAEQQAQGTPETQTYFLTFEDFWERKLWHQLTDSLVEFFRMKESAPQRLPIFKAFVLSFADRINQLKFVALGLMASTECSGEFKWVSGLQGPSSFVLGIQRIANSLRAR
jgi:26S proteasome regulatory subunit N9